MNSFYSTSPQSTESDSSQQTNYNDWNGYPQQYCGYTTNSDQQAYYCQTAPNLHLSTTSQNNTDNSAAPLPAISNFMKELQVKDDYNDYYTAGQQMSDYRVEKVVNPLADPYTQLEQPIYTEFTNTPLPSQQDMMNHMNFSNSLSANYMTVMPVTQPSAVPLNLFDFNLSAFPSFNTSVCEPTALPLMHQSPSQQTYVMAAHSTFTPPPQDPLVPEQKPAAKKRMAAVQCHQNSICSNCKTRETTLWRRNGEGGVECNACNLYFRKNNRKRPLSLRKDGIMKRNRRPRNQSPNGGIRRQGHAAAC